MLLISIQLMRELHLISAVLLSRNEFENLRFSIKFFTGYFQNMSDEVSDIFVRVVSDIEISSRRSYQLVKCFKNFYRKANTDYFCLRLLIGSLKKPFFSGA